MVTTVIVGGPPHELQQLVARSAETFLTPPCGFRATAGESPMRRSRVWVGLIGGCALSVSACGTAQLQGVRVKQAASAAARQAPGSQPSLNAQGTSSTPGVFRLPQMGFVSFRCDRHFRVEPFFDTHGATATERVMVRAGKLRRSNFKTRRVHGGAALRETTYSNGQVIALPFAHYRTVVFAVSNGDEARALTAKVNVQFVAGVLKERGWPDLGACYAKRWSISMIAKPY
jgi:hypothetical protein